jgi:two-component system response regulator FixJ
MSAQPIVYVVDDDPAVNRLLAEVVKGIELNVEAYESAEKFLEAHNGTGPGCLVLDVRIPGMSGMELQRQLTAAGSTLPIIFVTGHADVRMAVEAMEHGAFGFLEKPFRIQELCEKIQNAVRRDMEAWRRREEREDAAGRLAQLTPAERKVADRLTAGKTNKMIAQELGLSTRTIEAQRARLMERLGIRSRTELVRLMAAVAPFSGCGDETLVSSFTKPKHCQEGKTCWFLPASATR